MKIQAALLTEPNRTFHIETLDLADPGPGEVRVRLVASGVCHSDWHVATGDTQHPMPCVCGHEGAGVVEAVGDGVTRVAAGDHVTLSWTPDCGGCFYCMNNQPNLCETYTGPIWDGVMLDDSPRLSWRGQPVYHYCGTAPFAEHTVVPEQICVKIRKDVPLKVASLVGCAVATGVGAVLYTAGVKPGQSVVVYGAGGVGLNTIQAAALCGASTIIAIDTNQPKLDIARTFGATHGLIAGPDALGAVRELTGGRGADHVFESVGSPAVQEAAFEAVRPGGTLTLVGLAPMGTGTNLPGAIITRREVTIKGSYYGGVNPQRDFPLFLDMYMNGQLKLDQLISQEYKLDQINQAYSAMLTGEIARGIITF